MELFKYLPVHGHEEVAFRYDQETGLKTIIAIHDTTLGPALGGVRMWPYTSEEAALLDVLRLSEGMTYKAAVAGLNLGGGKAVIIGDPARDKKAGFFRAFGRFVDSFQGRYITAEDVGTTVEDMVAIREETRFVTGLPKKLGGSGDPSPLTALGVYQGIRACCEARFSSNSLQERTIVVQGAGKVGSALVRHLYKEGARIIVADINQVAARSLQRKWGVELVDPAEVYGIRCDVFSPCALGAVINDETLPQLRCAIVAGAANNQLAEPRHGDALHHREILYAPDYVINAGGLINVASECGAYDKLEAWSRVAAIYDTVRRVLGLAVEENIPPYYAAQRLAQERLTKQKQLTRQTRTGKPWSHPELELLRTAA